MPARPRIPEQRSTVHINLPAIRHNAKVLRDFLRGTSAGTSRIIRPAGLCAVLKGDAYGLGAVEVARVVGPYAQLFAVYDEAQMRELLREIKTSVPILVLMPTYRLRNSELVEEAMRTQSVHLTIHSPLQLGLLADVAKRRGWNIRVHVEVDTGMSRAGCSLQEAPSLLRRIRDLNGQFTLSGIFTHFNTAASDPAFTIKQHLKFQRLLRDTAPLIPPGCLVHEANTLAAIASRHYHQNLVRMGLGLAGFGPEALSGRSILPPGSLRPSVTWTSWVSHVQRIPRGAAVGYDSLWKSKRPTWVGSIPVGYGDGFPRAVSRLPLGKPAKVAVFFGGRGELRRVYCPVIGAVNLDQISVDLTDAVNVGIRSGVNVGVFSKVELISPDPSAPNHLPELARRAGTIAHELLTNLRLHPCRKYVRTVKC
ncbi:MAG TPA: alanine racemase [Tepidisphaeraceae bacterium]|jgi:alanine racemase|nr:alanine racemase [Tepidisphaeraceae bacterium]